MSPFLHPKLAILWLVLVMALTALNWLLAIRGSNLFLYTFPCLCQNVAQWYFVFHTAHWHQFYICWWVAQFAIYFISLALILSYAFDCLRYSPALPSSLVSQASWLGAGVIGTYLLLAWYNAIPYGSKLATVDQGVQLLLAVIAAIVAACCHFFPFDECERNILKGFVAMYILGFMVASLSGYEQQQFASLTLQLGVVAWWAWAAWAQPRLPQS